MCTLIPANILQNSFKLVRCCLPCIRHYHIQDARHPVRANHQPPTPHFMQVTKQCTTSQHNASCMDTIRGSDLAYRFAHPFGFCRASLFLQSFRFPQVLRPIHSAPVASGTNLSTYHHRFTGGTVTETSQPHALQETSFLESQVERGLGLIRANLVQDGEGERCCTSHNGGTIKWQRRVSQNMDKIPNRDMTSAHRRGS